MNGVRSMTKEALAMCLGQLAKLRNPIRHSREATAITRNDGEAAIGRFREALEAAPMTRSRDGTLANA